MKKTKVANNLILCLILISSFIVTPIIAYGEEATKMPDQAIIFMAPMSPEGNYGEVNISSDDSGEFSFVIPEITWFDSYGNKHTISSFSIEGNVYITKEEERFYFSDDEYLTVYKDRVMGNVSVIEQSVFIRKDHAAAPDEEYQYETYEFATQPGVITVSEGNNDAMLTFRFQSIVNYTHETNYVLAEDFYGENVYSDKLMFHLKANNFSFTGLGTNNQPNTFGSNDEDSSLADPLTTLTISIIAILISIFLSSSGSYTAPVASGPSIQRSSFGKWIKIDSDGDLEAKDPITGNTRVFVDEGDGTYKDPISGTSYTLEEINDQMEYRSRNEQTISKDENQFRQNVAKDREANKERSSYGKDVEKESRERKEQTERDLRKLRVTTNLGIKDDASREHIQSAYEHERDSELANEDFERIKELDKTIDTLETYETAADTILTIGEAAPGVDVVSASYKGVKNFGKTLAEKGVSTGTVIEGAIKGGTEAASTMMKQGMTKVGTTIGGNMAGKISEAYNDGTSLSDAATEGFVKGTVDSAIGSISDKASSLSSDTKAGAAVKIAEIAFTKNISDPAIEKLFNKTKND